MTKESLYSVINSYTRNVSYDFEQLLDEFFDSNVCIPKGENRHPYADVLHKMAEDMTKSFQVKYIYQDLGWSTFDSYTDYAFREKPSEPVYEWQWLAQDINTKKVFITLYTKNENPEFINSVPLYRIEETKRIRDVL